MKHGGIVMFRTQELLSTLTVSLLSLPAFGATTYIIKMRAGAELPPNLKMQTSLPKLGLAIVSAEPLEAFVTERNTRVEFIEPEIIFKAPSGPQLSPGAKTSKSFASPSSTWGLQAVRSAQAWAAATRNPYGRGARVAVLDTGIDREHADLRAAFEDGRDFSDGWLQSDSNFSDSVGHGTHVSGTIAGARGDHGAIGVAPGARVIMAKVCTNSGCSSSDIVKGMEWAIEQKVDVMNMSIGSKRTSRAISSALTSADQSGIAVVVSSGNENASEVTFPASVPSVIAVGAINEQLERAIWNSGKGGSNYGGNLSVMAPGNNVLSSVPTGSGQESHVLFASGEEFASVPMRGTPFTKVPITAEIVDVGFGTDSDYSNRDLSGKIALVERGADVSFRNKVKGAHEHDAIGVILFNDKDGLVPGSVLTEDGAKAAIPASMIEQKIGQALRARMAAGETVSLQLAIIESSYGLMNGTSMAAPHVTGVIALMKAENPNLTPSQIKAILKSTAHPLKCSTNEKNECGAGLVDAEAAVKASSI